VQRIRRRLPGLQNPFRVRWQARLHSQGSPTFVGLPWARLQNAFSVLLLGLLACAMLGAATVCWCGEPSVAPVKIVRLTATKATVSLAERATAVLEVPGRIKVVDGFDRAIVKISTTRVALLDNFNQVHVLALAPGSTGIDVTDEAGNRYSVNVTVDSDRGKIDGARAPAGGVLHLTNGGVVTGELKGSVARGHLGWQSPLFAGPFEFEVNAVSSVNFPLPARLPKPVG